MVEPMAVPIYILIALGAACSAIFVPALGFHVDLDVWPYFIVWPFLTVSGMLLRRVGHARSATAVEGVGLIYAQGFGFVFLLFPLSAISRPFADVILNGADRALGFDWLSYARIVAPITPVLQFAYHSFNWQPAVVILALCVTHHERRVWKFVFASAAALAVDVAIFPFLPARGPLQFYHFPDAHPFGDVIALLKAGHRTISPDLFTGFISFPSYHAASCLLFGWAVWPVKLLRVPILALNFVMLAATLTVGGHYLVDIVAGLLVASGSLRLSETIVPPGTLKTGNACGS
jgi:membrane-associated phospholipid phosphatase